MILEIYSCGLMVGSLAFQIAFFSMLWVEVFFRVTEIHCYYTDLSVWFSSLFVGVFVSSLIVLFFFCETAVITYLNPGETAEIDYMLGSQTDKPFPPGNYRVFSKGWVENGQRTSVWAYAEFTVDARAFIGKLIGEVP